jgi:hypothetical protein
MDEEKKKEISEKIVNKLKKNIDSIMAPYGLYFETPGKLRRAVLEYMNRKAKKDAMEALDDSKAPEKLPSNLDIC